MKNENEDREEAKLEVTTSAWIQSVDPFVAQERDITRYQKTEIPNETQQIFLPRMFVIRSWEDIPKVSPSGGDHICDWSDVKTYLFFLIPGKVIISKVESEEERKGKKTIDHTISFCC
jgi:hypothetical protein